MAEVSQFDKISRVYLLFFQSNDNCGDLSLADSEQLIQS